MQRVLFAAGCFVVTVLLTGLVLAHGGGLDAHGGHGRGDDGTYHFHHGPLKGRSFPSKADALAALAALEADASGTPPAKPAAGPAREPSAAPDPGSVEHPQAAERLARLQLRVEALERLLIERRVVTRLELEDAARLIEQSRRTPPPPRPRRETPRDGAEG